MTGITGNSYIDSLATRGASSSAAAGTGQPSGTLDQTAFLKLMTTQLQTQDPFDPVDNSQMVAQMAQFSSVTGIAEMNASLKAISAEMASSRVGDAAGWIGRAALVPSDTMVPVGDTYAGQIVLPDDATDVTISLIDGEGRTVHAGGFKDQKAGEINFSWDGKDEAGKVVATGPLTLRVTANGAEGAIYPTTAAWTPVTGVQSPASGDAKLVTPIGLVAINDVQSLG